MFILLLTTPVLRLQAQQEEARELSGGDSGRSMFWAGIETSTTACIDNHTGDSNGLRTFFAPYVDYHHKSGFGLNLRSYAFADGSDPGFFLTAISPYFAAYKGRVWPYISYSRFITHDNPAFPYTPIQNELYAHLRIRTPYVDPSLGMDLGWGKDAQENNNTVTDLNTFVSLNHLFLKSGLARRGGLTLGALPSVQLNAGTDRYFNFLQSTGFVSRNAKLSRLGYGGGRARVNGGPANGGGPGSGGPSSGTSVAYGFLDPANDFGITNLQAGLQLIAFFGPVSIEPYGSLYFPLRGDDRTVYGYWQLSVSYWF